MSEAAIGSRAWVAKQFDVVEAELRGGRASMQIWLQAYAESVRWIRLGQCPGAERRTVATSALSLLVELQCSLTGDEPSTVMHEVRTMLAKGQREYGGQADAFEQFKEAADMLDLQSEEVLAVYLHKHLIGIKRHFEGITSQREDVSGRVLDAMVYFVLAILMHEAAELLSGGAE